MFDKIKLMYPISILGKLNIAFLGNGGGGRFLKEYPTEVEDKVPPGT